MRTAVPSLPIIWFPLAAKYVNVGVAGEKIVGKMDWVAWWRVVGKIDGREKVDNFVLVAKLIFDGILLGAAVKSCCTCDDSMISWLLRRKYFRLLDWYLFNKNKNKSGVKKLFMVVKWLTLWYNRNKISEWLPVLILVVAVAEDLTPYLLVKMMLKKCCWSVEVLK